MTAFNEIQEAYQVFPQQVQSLMLATVSATGMPHVSYAPFVMDEAHHIYLFLSDLAIHTQDLKATSKASVMFIEDEGQATQIFARRRLTYETTVSVVDPTGELWDAMATQFEQRFGEIMTMLRSLADFHMFRLTPTAGRFVVGFGAAYRVNPHDWNQLLPPPEQGNKAT